MFTGEYIYKAMKSDDHLVCNLGDEISDEVLKSKSEEDIASGSSSVAQWINSLKESNLICDDSSKECSQGYSACSSSNQDDLSLGAEATDIQRKHRTHNSPSISDSDGSSRWYSWTGRMSSLTNRLSYDRSYDSDTSALSSATSVSSLLTARESDPEDVLKGLGFCGPGVLDKIPERFITTGTVCEGVDSGQFLRSMQDSENATYMDSEIPPWVMARYDDIPRKFWNEKSDSMFTESTTDHEASYVNEPSSAEETKEDTRPVKTCPSKFGTYLEPVTEEVELSSQGSATFSPTQIKTLSFESTRSTLKGNSQDSLSMTTIPSLSDLWQASEGEQKTFALTKSEDHGIATGEPGDSIPGSIVPASNRSEETDYNYNGDWIDKCRDDQEVDPVVTSGQWCAPQTDNSIPSLSVYFAEDTSSLSDNQNPSPVDSDPALSQCPELMNSDSATVKDRFDVSDLKTTSTPRHLPILRIPTVTISEPVGNSRKMSTVNPPDIEKLSPVVTNSSRSSTIKNTKEMNNFRCQKQTTSTQLNMYGSQNWTTVENKRRPQIQLSYKGTVKSPRKLSLRSRKATIGSKVTVTVNQCSKANQITISGHRFETFPCFSNFDEEISSYSEYSRRSTIQSLEESDRLKNEQRTFISLPLQQTEDSKFREPFHAVSYYRTFERMPRHHNTDDDQDSSRKNKCLSTRTDDLKSGGYFKNGLSIQDGLDELQNSLKGVKMYKAGIHLMQLASSVETVMCSDKRPKRLQQRSRERLLNCIQQELKHLEKYIFRLQTELQGINKQSVMEHPDEDVKRRESESSNFSDLTRQLLHEQLKMFSSISSTTVSPVSSPSASREPSLSSETPDVLRHTDVMKLKKEIQELRQDSVERNSSLKEEILHEVREEIRNCFKEFFQTKNP